MRKANSYIYTYSGKRVDPLNPQIDDIDILDIAYGLAGIYRYGGQTRISVLRHSIALAQTAENENEKLYALLHDAAEVYMGDQPTSIKSMMNKQWCDAYQRFEDLIFKKFNVQASKKEKDGILRMDKLVVEYEMNSRRYVETGSKISYPETPGLFRDQYLAFESYYQLNKTETELMQIFIRGITLLSSPKGNDSVESV